MEQLTSRTELANATHDEEPTSEISEILPTQPSSIPIRNLIYTVRGMQVMLDSDLAKLYQVETKALNRAAKRNEGRFPEDFRFQVNRDELDSLRCQIGTLESRRDPIEIGRTYLPYVYTEQGVAMLSAVLRSKVAVDTSVQIMRAFVEMRHFLANNAVLFDQIRKVEFKQIEYQRQTDERFQRVFDYMEVNQTPTQKIFFDGQVYDAFELLVSLIRRAEKEITLVDGYVDTGTLNLLAKKQPKVPVELWTRRHPVLTEQDIATFNEQYPLLQMQTTNKFHDRFLILDRKEGYLIGTSLKDAEKRAFGIVRLEDQEHVQSILQRLDGLAQAQRQNARAKKAQTPPQ
jgi:hypothetical protein